MRRLPMILILTVALRLIGAAQTDDSGVRQVHAPKPKPAASSHTKQTGSGAPKSRPKPAGSSKSSAYGSLSILVSEPEARVYLTNAKGVSTISGEYAVSPRDGSPFVAALAAGEYTLVVRKDNFIDDEQRVTVVRGKITPVQIVMRPSVAFITVEANVPDPEIEIVGLGRFHGVQHSPVLPGAYTVNVRKKGYLVGTQTVTITSPGTETRLSFSLNAVSIDDLISKAEAAVTKQEYDDALKICSEIIDIKEDESRAYKIRGDVLFRRGASGADAAWLNALKYGGVVTLPVKLRAGPALLIAGDLSFDRDYIQFRSAVRPELNFSLAKSGVAAVAQAYDAQNVPLIGFQGTGDFAGKRVKRIVTLYSQAAFLRSTQKEAFCSEVAGGAFRCTADIETLNKLISRWLTELR